MTVSLRNVRPLAKLASPVAVSNPVQRSPKMKSPRIAVTLVILGCFCRLVAHPPDDVAVLPTPSEWERPQPIVVTVRSEASGLPIAGASVRIRKDPPLVTKLGIPESFYKARQTDEGGLAALFSFGMWHCAPGISDRFRSGDTLIVEAAGYETTEIHLGKWAGPKHFHLDEPMAPWVPVVLKAKGEQGGSGQSAARPESDSEGSDKPQPESEGRSR